jgi:hypothetical protein
LDTVELAGIAMDAVVGAPASIVTLDEAHDDVTVEYGVPQASDVIVTA